MLYGKYNFQLLLESEALLPPFKGSTFRGVFGVALKKVVCALKRQECESCLLREQCVYTTVFEIPSGENSKGTPSPPHPFIIEPSLDSQTHFQAGEGFDFNLILLGRVNDYLPYFVYAIEQMGQIGIGRRINGKRSSFQLQRITAGGQVVYDSENKRLKAVQPDHLTVEKFIDPNLVRSNEELSLNLLTPLRLKFDNRLQADLPFHVLIRAALRRIALLCNHFGDGEPALDYKGLVARAEKVEVGNSSLGWFDWKRYSNRQEQSMLMGGMVGEIAYQGDLNEFIPLIRYGEKVHLGKATTFGLGQISIVSPSPPVGEGGGEGDHPQ
ncbi:MAG: CRISPR system precrRNA processing endoribonuclease RAMP protein Cas6 [Deltaproteobacteria bacterium]|nr:CRISPR system precrRNA processing endoribonuclease RAMP protein Cas6 [Deltaproteobacteria bacterium]